MKTPKYKSIKALKHKNIRINKDCSSFFMFLCSSEKRFLCFNKEAFTLIETIIYVAIIGAVVTSFVSFGMSISSARNKNYAIQEVQANTRIAINIVQQKIREANGINIGASTFGSDPGVLSLSMSDAGKNPTIISLNQDNGQMQITEGVNPPIFLTSGKVKITNLVFNNLTPLHGKGNIGIDLKTEYNIINADKSFQYEKSIRTAENLRQ